MLPRDLISFADRPRHQLEINLITNILSWLIGHCEYIIKFWCLQMPPLQDSALHLYDARTTRLEVFFHFIIIIIFIMDLVLRVRKAFIQVKYGLVSPMRYITALQSEMSFGYTFFFLFFNTRVSLSQAWSCTRDILFGVQAYLSFVRQVSAAIVLLSKHVFSLAARLRITRASCGCHLYKRRWYFMG